MTYFVYTAAVNKKVIKQIKKINDRYATSSFFLLISTKKRENFNQVALVLRSLQTQLCRGSDVWHEVETQN